MPTVRIERGSNMPTITRADVKPGQIFSVKTRSGALGRKKYAHLGSNGKLYSVNVDSKDIASTRKGTSRVVLVGKFKYVTDISPTGKRVTTRGQVRDGEIFRVNGEDNGNAQYLHMGTKRTGELLSVNLTSHNIASTSNTRSAVTVIGKGSLQAEVV